jgi:Putative RNA methylase family UPF0020
MMMMLSLHVPLLRWIVASIPLSYALTTKSPIENFFLAKTKETFKFADLQFLEARLECQSDVWKNSGIALTCERLLLDAATGSTLFGIYSNVSLDKFTTENENIPSSWRRCEWMVQVLAHSESASDLVQSLREQGGIFFQDCTGWTLDYIRMSSVQRQKVPSPNRNYNQRSLLCAVAQCLQAPAALDPIQASHHLILVETTRDIYLGRFLWQGPRPSWNPLPSWSQRPFQYSAAIHPTVAEILVDMILNLIRTFDCTEPTHLWDPTCGSGTFLAYALATNRNVLVEGWDVNPQCVEGTSQNLRYAFGENVVDAKCRLLLQDSSISKKNNHHPFVDGLIANLPWGKNTIDYVDQNQQILKSVRTRLKEGAPCIFIHKDAALSNPDHLQTLGYQWLEEAYIPPLDFVLPPSRKKKPKNDSGDADDEEDLTPANPIVQKHQRVTVVRAA